MKPTALTELIQKIDSDISNALSTMPLNTPFIEYLRQHREFAIRLLQKDREDKQRAYVDGITHRSEFKCKLPEDYFNQTFTQYKTEEHG